MDLVIYFLDTVLTSLSTYQMIKGDLFKKSYTRIDLPGAAMRILLQIKLMILTNNVPDNVKNSHGCLINQMTSRRHWSREIILL